MVWKLAELSNNSFEWKNVTFKGSKVQNKLWPPAYFEGSGPPNSPWSTPLIQWLHRDSPACLTDDAVQQPALRCSPSVVVDDHTVHIWLRMIRKVVSSCNLVEQQNFSVWTAQPNAHRHRRRRHRRRKFSQKLSPNTKQLVPHLGLYWTGLLCSTVFHF